MSTPDKRPCALPIRRLQTDVAVCCSPDVDSQLEWRIRFRTGYHKYTVAKAWSPATLVAVWLVLAPDRGRSQPGAVTRAYRSRHHKTCSVLLHERLSSRAVFSFQRYDYNLPRIHLVRARSYSARLSKLVAFLAHSEVVHVSLGVFCSHVAKDGRDKMNMTWIVRLLLIEGSCAPYTGRGRVPLTETQKEVSRWSKCSDVFL